MRFVERLRSIYDGVVGVEEAHTARERRYCARKSNEGRHRFIVCTSHHHITLLGEFKGELGYKYHLMFLASTTTLGVRRDPKVLRRVSWILNKEGLHIANLFNIFE